MLTEKEQWRAPAVSTKHGVYVRCDVPAAVREAFPELYWEAEERREPTSTGVLTYLRMSGFTQRRQECLHLGIWLQAGRGVWCLTPSREEWRAHRGYIAGDLGDLLLVTRQFFDALMPRVG